MTFHKIRFISLKGISISSLMWNWNDIPQSWLSLEMVPVGIPNKHCTLLIVGFSFHRGERTRDSHDGWSRSGIWSKFSVVHRHQIGQSTFLGHFVQSCPGDQLHRYFDRSRGPTAQRVGQTRASWIGGTAWGANFGNEVSLVFCVVYLIYRQNLTCAGRRQAL